MSDLKQKLKEKKNTFALARKTQFTRFNMIENATEKLKKIKKTDPKNEIINKLENKIKLLNDIEERNMNINANNTEYPNYD